MAKQYPEMPEPWLLTVEQVAAMVNFSKRKVWRLTAAKKFPQPIKEDGSTRWLRDEVIEWIEQKKRERKPAA